MTPDETAPLRKTGRERRSLRASLALAVLQRATLWLVRWTLRWDKE